MPACLLTKLWIALLIKIYFNKMIINFLYVLNKVLIYIYFKCVTMCFYRFLSYFLKQNLCG